ncbi:MAG: hypothetical protein GY835_22905, partial [bacterium]|nr:hypothetical protein [bacterium]
FSSVAGRVHIGYGLNATSGIGFSEWGAYSAAMALGYPVDLDVVVLDEESDTLELAEFYREFEGDDFGVDSCDDYTNGICEFDIELSSSVARDSVTTWREDWCEGERAWYHYQRVTVDNLTTGQSWSIDIENQWGEQDGGNIGRGTVEKIRARRGDKLRVRYNIQTLGYIAMMGSGITVVDLNAYYRTPGPSLQMATDANQCGRRLQRFEGEHINFEACGEGGSWLRPPDDLSTTRAVAAHGFSGCEWSNGAPTGCRGEYNLDIYAPVFNVALHTRSRRNHPANISSIGGSGADEETVTCTANRLWDVELANEVKWIDRGVEGEFDSDFKPSFRANTQAPEEREGELLFVAGEDGILVFDVSDRELNDNLIGHLTVRDHAIYKLQVERKLGLLFAGGFDISTEPWVAIIDIWNLATVNSAPDSATETAPLLTLRNIPWTTHNLAIDRSGAGLLHTWDHNRGAIAVPFSKPQFLFAGLYQPEDEDSGSGDDDSTSYITKATRRFVPLGVPMETSIEDEDDPEIIQENERQATAAFKVRVALPGSVGEEFKVKVQSMRMLPAPYLLGQ